MNKYIEKNKRALLGGILATSFTALGVFLLGNISGYEAKNLLEVSLNGLNMLCNTIVLASATILALLLTLLGISSGSNSNLKEKHYIQVLSIAKFDVILFVAALILFQLFNIPIIESDSVPTSWFKIIYWATLLFSSIICGMMVTVILMLYNTITNMIAIIGLKKDHKLLTKDEDLDTEE
ncbi:MAG: hypothetical protein ACSHW7_11530 [Patiriisocius sp.]|uniref:hypothetical protein n=1 Tax=Patiriisocius sp. TaxID=2822396 RepID=UPI003EF4E998